MTTNAIDRKNLQITSDSRWSATFGDEIFYVDDTDFDKITSRAVGSIICAGDGQLIEGWRNWFMAPIINHTALPPTERQGKDGLESITISLVRSKTGSVMYSSGWYLNFDDYAHFSGSGATYAVECFARHQCSLRCIESAARKDPATGGSTKFVDLISNRNNLSSNPVSLADAMQLLHDRGYAMNMTTKKITPIKERLSAVDPAARALSAGDFSLSAPTGLPQRAWTEAERERLRSAMKTLADIEAEATS